MIGSIFAQHVPLIRDYPSAPPPPPAPPAPPQPPQPPQAEPIAFSVVTRASLFGIVGSAISSTTLATVTCADAAMTIAQSEPVAGLTFSYSAGVLTIAGTPTGSTRVQRVVVSYIASDGSNSVRGSTSHEITLVSASEVLTIGTIAGITGRVGYPLNQVICTPSANFDANVLSFGNTAILGLTTQWTWDRALMSGELRVVGTPLQGFGPDGGFQFAFIANQQELGVGIAPCTIVQGYEAPAPAPAPVPAPPPPAPSPPPAPTPAPAPGLGPDPFRPQTKVLLHFDKVLLGIGYDPASTAITLAGKNDAPGQNWFNAPHCYQQVNPGLGYLQRFGYDPMSGGFYSTANGFNSRMEASIAGIDGAAGPLTFEALADIDQACWDAHRNAAGAINRYSPAVSLISADGVVAWSFGFFSTSGMRYSSDDPRRVVMTAFMQRIQNGALQFLIGRYLTDMPGKFLHIAGQRTHDFGIKTTAGWTDGLPWVNSISYGGEFFSPAEPLCRIGNACQAAGLAVYGGAGAEQIPFLGRIDEVRITAAARYTTYVLATLPPSARVIPWPNY